MSFEPGAPVADEMIPLCVPVLNGNEWDYVKECLDTNWVSSVGPFVDRFEKMMAEFTHQAFAVATVNGTSALHIALLVAGIAPDDEVLVSTLSFIAPANAIRYAGAWPVFMDAEPDYWQIDPQKVADFLNKECQWREGNLYNKATRRRVKAIMPVHILGHPCDMDPISELARNYNLTIIEDATETLGGEYKQSMVGSMGDIACFSFNGNKIITTGGGGMIVTDNQSWAEKARYLTTQAKDDPLEYIHAQIGYNYRLTNIQAAMGCAQLEKLNEYIGIKRKIAVHYTKALGGKPGISTMREAPWASSIYWLYAILVEEEKFGINSRQLLKRLRKSKIESRPLWQPLHLSPAHQGAFSYNCHTAERMYKDALNLPSSVNLSTDDQERVVGCILNSEN